MLWLTVPLAFIIDLLIGDPAFMPHPVQIIGRAISWLEKILRPRVSTPGSQRWSGCLLAAVIPGTVYAIVFGLCFLAGRIHSVLGLLVSVWLISTTISARGLREVGCSVYRHLVNGELEPARRVVDGIVGRDTVDINEQEMVRATVETIAENIVDGVIAPIFFAFIGGAPLAMAYRAINTLDSMVGYKNERYIDFGRASARLDDVANFIPARITGLLIIIAALMLRYSPVNAAKAMLRDSDKHPSPNSGIPEAGVAGALGVRLGGTNYYEGIPSVRPFMGRPLRALGYADIKHAIKFVYLTGALAVLGGSLVCKVFNI